MMIRVLSAVALLATAVRAGEQKIPRSRVPKSVLSAVEKKYPGAPMNSFEKEVKGGHTAYEIKVGGARPVEVALSEDGKIETEEFPATVGELPEPVRTAATSGKYQGWKALKAERIVNGEDEQKVTWEVYVTKGKQKREVVFTPDGKMVSDDKD